MALVMCFVTAKTQVTNTRDMLGQTDVLRRIGRLQRKLSILFGPPTLQKNMQEKKNTVRHWED